MLGWLTSVSGEHCVTTDIIKSQLGALCLTRTRFGERRVNGKFGYGVVLCRDLLSDIKSSLSTYEGTYSDCEGDNRLNDLYIRSQFSNMDGLLVASITPNLPAPLPPPLKQLSGLFDLGTQI